MYKATTYGYEGTRICRGKVVLIISNYTYVCSLLFKFYETYIDVDIPTCTLLPYNYKTKIGLPVVPDVSTSVPLFHLASFFDVTKLRKEQPFKCR